MYKQLPQDVLCTMDQTRLNVIYSSKYIYIFYFSLAFKMPLPWLIKQVARRCNDKTLGKIRKSDLFEDEHYIFDLSLICLQNAPSASPFSTLSSEPCLLDINYQLLD